MGAYHDVFHMFQFNFHMLSTVPSDQTVCSDLIQKLYCGVLYGMS
jgi:hypothetical protein